MNLQDNDSARYIVEAITQDNPHAQVQHQPAMIRVQAEGRLEI
ncbi:MmoB/DmpM family protein, partial [Pseudomonas kurunegalensis]